MKPLLDHPSYRISRTYDATADVVLLAGDSATTLKAVPSGSVKLIITSPPYNLGKEYETTQSLDQYLEGLTPVLQELVRVLADDGSLCWQVGNSVDHAEVFPLDIFFYPIFKRLGLKLRNRIVWHFEHGLHATKRFSGRYETLLWFTKSDTYTFRLDAVRVPSKYPGKLAYRGPNAGQPSGNPLGKNPSDVWHLVVQDWETALWDIPNVKSNHPEKTLHPCQFPIELVERCVLALTNEADWVLDPFSGVGSALLAALKHDRRALGCEKEAAYLAVAEQRVQDLASGALKYRPLGRQKHQPTGREKVARVPAAWLK
jgi:DNA modification methylase